MQRAAAAKIARDEAARKQKEEAEKVAKAKIEAQRLAEKRAEEAKQRDAEAKRRVEEAKKKVDALRLAKSKGVNKVVTATKSAKEEVVPGKKEEKVPASSVKSHTQSKIATKPVKVSDGSLCNFHMTN